MPSAPGTRIEYGDFQTPLELATRVASLLAQSGLTPCSVLDPPASRVGVPVGQVALKASRERAPVLQEVGELFEGHRVRHRASLSIAASAPSRQGQADPTSGIFPSPPSRPRKNIVLEQDSQLALSRNVKGCGSDRRWRSLMPLSAALMAACGHTCPRTHAAPTEEASSVRIRTKL